MATQRKAAKIFGIDQPGGSHLVRGNLRRFSIDRLFRFLHAVGRDIEIVVKPRSYSRTRISVRVAPVRKKSRKTV